MIQQARDAGLFHVRPIAMRSVELRAQLRRSRSREPVMTKWFSAVALVVAMTFAGSVRETAVASSTAMRQTHAEYDKGISARRYRHCGHDACRPSYYPSYYGRPTYYAPAPFYPIPPLFGFGWQSW
jgi:hypothetical protein